MNQERPRRYRLLFCAIVIGASLFDLYSKHLVFDDLGYPGGGQPLQHGMHEVFENPGDVTGRSRLYLDSFVVFQLYTNFNFGALWGMGQGFSFIFALFGIVAIIGILVWAFWFRGVESLWLTISLSLILAGTLGNLYDRMGLHGYEDGAGNTIYAVRDFLFFRFGGQEGYQWPIFNFADTFLVVGAAMMFLHSLFLPAPEKKTEAIATATPESTPQTSTST